jgi:hypothetical protein
MLVNLPRSDPQCHVLRAHPSNHLPKNYTVEILEKHANVQLSKKFPKKNIQC